MSMSEQKPSMVRWLRGEATSVWAAALGAMLSIANLPPASARQKLVASNIANAETPGYKTKDLDFRTEFANSLDA